MSQTKTDNLLLSNIMLHNGEAFTELHLGGIVTFDDLTKMPEFWDYLKANIDKSIKVELYAYCLYGNSGVTRDATTEEVEEIIDDEFPHSPKYANDLQGEDNESNPFGYTVRPYKHKDDSDEVFAIYKPVNSESMGNVLMEYECLSGEENHNETAEFIQSM